MGRGQVPKSQTFMVLRIEMVWEIRGDDEYG